MEGNAEAGLITGGVGRGNDHGDVGGLAVGKRRGKGDDRVHDGGATCGIRDDHKVGGGDAGEIGDRHGPRESAGCRITFD